MQLNGPLPDSSCTAAWACSIPSPPSLDHNCYCDCKSAARKVKETPWEAKMLCGQAMRHHAVRLHVRSVTHCCFVAYGCTRYDRMRSLFVQTSVSMKVSQGSCNMQRVIAIWMQQPELRSMFLSLQVRLPLRLLLRKKHSCTLAAPQSMHPYSKPTSAR